MTVDEFNRLKSHLGKMVYTTIENIQDIEETLLKIRDEGVFKENLEGDEVLFQEGKKDGINTSMMNIFDSIDHNGLEKGFRDLLDKLDGFSVIIDLADEN